MTKGAESQIALSGYTAVSYGGYLNGESFQQDNGPWEKFDFADYEYRSRRA